MFDVFRLRKDRDVCARILELACGTVDKETINVIIENSELSISDKNNEIVIDKYGIKSYPQMAETRRVRGVLDDYVKDATK